MNVLRLHGHHDLRLSVEPIPTPEPGERLVKIGAMGICGSDLHWFAEAGIGDAKLTHPLVLGHELAGWTENGQLVAIDPCIPCGQCEFCLTGCPNLCLTQRFAGHGKDDGGLREYLAWPERCLFPLPQSFTPADGAMLEPLGVAMYTLELSRIRPGETVGIFGLGPIGQLVAQLVVRATDGLTVAIEKLPHRLETVSSLGVRALLANGWETSVIPEMTKGRGLDVVIEVAGDQGAVNAAVAAVRPGGRVVLAGIPSEDRTSFVASIARRKELNVQWVRRMKNTYPRAIELVSKGLVDVRTPVTHFFPLEQAQQAFEVASRREGMKVVVTMD
jgi:L-iditol 2-dehydrogenase